MKRLNSIKFIVFLCSTLILQGCLPDSLTKFNKEATKKASTTGTSITDDSGNTITASTFVNPTFFKMRQNVTALSTLTFEVGKSLTSSTFDWIADGEFEKGSSVITAIYIRCALDVDSTDGISKNDILPPGVSLTSDCKFTGTPTTVYSNDTTGNVGKAIPYYIRLYFKNIKGQSGTVGAVTCPSTSECYIKSNVFNMATYIAPQNLKMSQSDKIGLKLTSFAKDMTSFPTDDSADSLDLATITSESNAIGLTKVQQPTKNTILVLRAIPISVTDVSEFVIGETAGKFDTITVGDASGIAVDDTIISDSPGNYIGTVSSKSGNTLTVFRSSGSTLGSTINSSATSIVSSNIQTSPAYGTVVNIDTVNKIVYVTQSPDFSGTFAATDVIIPYNGTTSLTISSIDDSVGIRTKDKIDNDKQYYSQEAQVVNAYSYYPIGSAITPIYPITSNNDSLADANGIAYSISPALPSGLTFCSSASISGCPGVGYIIGTFASEFDPTDFTITAKNGIASTTYLFGLAARQVPKDLSYTREQVIRVKNTNSNPAAVFYEGENIYQPIVSPATESVHAKIKRKFTDSVLDVTGKQSMLEIATSNGQFLPGASIDSGRKYVSEKAYISSTYKSYNFNVILYLTSVTNFDVGNYIKNSQNPAAKARIVYIDQTRKAVYAQYLTPDVSSSTTPGVFSENETVTEYDTTDTSTATTSTVDGIETETYKLAISGSFTGFDIGYDITANTGTSKVGAYIYETDTSGATNYIFVNKVTRAPSATTGNVVSAASQNLEFRRTQLIAADERYPSVAPTTSISGVSHDNLFVVKRSESMYLAPNVSSGTNLYYTVDSDLPKGITLNSTTGVISGTPTILTPRKTYIITAKNIMGSSSFKFDLEVQDEFSISENSDSTSYVLHKVGDTQNTRGCSINATDILNGTGNLDIRCFMDTSEQDLYKLGLKFKALVGSGVCEYIQYAPYSFQQYPAKTFADNSASRSYNYVSGCEKNTSDGNYADFLPGTCSDGTKTTKATCLAASATWTDNYTTTKPKNSLTYCPANYSDSSSAFPNCDEDSFTVVTMTSSINSSGACVSTLSTSEVVKCNGNINSCISGPIKEVLDSKDILKGYRSMIYQVSDGATLSWNHTAPYTKGYYTNIALANGTKANTLSTTQSDLTGWSDYITSLSNTAKSKANTQTQRNTALRMSPFVNGNPVYTFNCLDAAQGVKAKINIVVRDWDKTFKVTDSLDAESPTLMNGTSADNQYLDWDDDYFTTINMLYSSDLPKADYSGGSCSAGGYTNVIDCITNGKIWTPTAEYAFPGDEL